MLLCLQMFITQKNLVWFFIRRLGCRYFMLARRAKFTVQQLQCNALCIICSAPQEPQKMARCRLGPTASLAGSNAVPGGALELSSEVRKSKEKSR